MKIHKTPRHKMRFISSACRFIISSIVLVAVTVIAVTNYTFSRQNRQYNVNYNLSAATGLAKLLENQEDSFMQCINNAYVTYYSYREGIFSFFNASNRNSYAYRQNIYRFLSESFSLNSQIASMTIYSAGDQQIYSVTKSSSFHFQELLPEFQPLADSYGSPYTRLVICPSRSGELLGTAGSYSFVYCLRDVVTRENIGAIQADFSSAELERFLSSNYPGVMGDFLVLDPEKNVLFDTSGSWYSQDRVLPDAFISDTEIADSEVSIAGQTCLLNRIVLSDSGMTVIGLISQEELQKNIRQTITLMLLITAAIALATITGIYLYINRSTKQLNKIYYSMLEVKNGNFDIRIPVDHPPQSEFDDISIAFNDMLRDLNVYIEKVYKSEIDSQKYRLKVLQSQINPHFLYNTLEAIRMKAILNGEPEIDEMIFILAKILRNSIKGSSMVSVRQEVDNCRNYLRLCDLEYSSLFDYAIRVDPALLSENIIQHALIVMVENYIMHGFDSSRTDNSVSITGAMENGFAVFRVEDNGFGIGEDELAALRNSLTEKSLEPVERIGLKNIYQRARLLYGDQCDLQIHSVRGRGTRVMFSFALGKEETHAAGDHY